MHLYLRRKHTLQKPHRSKVALHDQKQNCGPLRSLCCQISMQRTGLPQVHLTASSKKLKTVSGFILLCTELFLQIKISNAIYESESNLNTMSLACNSFISILRTVIYKPTANLPEIEDDIKFHYLLDVI